MGIFYGCTNNDLVWDESMEMNRLDDEKEYREKKNPFPFNSPSGSNSNSRNTSPKRNNNAAAFGVDNTPPSFSLQASGNYQTTKSPEKPKI